MLEHDFYPTPDDLIGKMIAPYMKTFRESRYLSGGKWFLDPSAGAGNILDYLTKRLEIDKRRCAAIEIVPELRYILGEKGYKIIDTDFLEYAGYEYIDFILMNPPFSYGAEHLLKAWDIMKTGVIICILNAETLRNANTEKRKLLKWIVSNNSSHPPEYIQGAFRNADRPTGVEIVIVRLEKKTEDRLPGFDYVNFDHAENPVSDEEFQASPLAHFDIIETLVQQYTVAARLTKEIHTLAKQKRFYMSSVENTKGDDPNAPETLNNQLDKLKETFWNYIFQKTKIGRVTTSDFHKKFDQFVKQTGSIAFTSKNIREVLEMFMMNRETIMQDCLLSVFDKATSYHEKNRVHTEGWKTNKSYKVNKRIIMPNGVTFEKQWSTWKVNYHEQSFYNDLDKVMCFLSGSNFERIQSTYETIENHFGQINAARYGRSSAQTPHYASVICSSYFQIRVYKKGTVHLDFTNEKLWQELNIQAAKGKGWAVGPGY